MTTKRNDDMLPEYDFSKGERGKFAKRFSRDTRYVSIDPDLAEYFPEPDDINTALRFLATSFSPEFLKQVLKGQLARKSKKAS